MTQWLTHLLGEQKVAGLIPAEDTDPSAVVLGSTSHSQLKHAELPLWQEALHTQEHVHFVTYQSIINNPLLVPVFLRTAPVLYLLQVPVRTGPGLSGADSE